MKLTTNAPPANISIDLIFISVSVHGEVRSGSLKRTENGKQTISPREVSGNPEKRNSTGT